MMYSDTDLRQAIKSGEIRIDPYRQEHVSGATIDLTLHDTFLVFRNTSVTHIDVRHPFDVTEKVSVNAKDKSFVIHPGEFVLGSTAESVSLANTVSGIIEGRSSLGRIGLIVHATASMVKPGFSGFLTLEITNISRLPIKLYAGMRIAQLAVMELKSPSSIAYGKGGGKYQDQDRPTPSKIWKDFE